MKGDYAVCAFNQILNLNFEMLQYAEAKMADFIIFKSVIFASAYCRVFIGSPISYNTFQIISCMFHLNMKVQLILRSFDLPDKK